MKKYKFMIWVIIAVAAVVIALLFLVPGPSRSRVGLPGGIVIRSGVSYDFPVDSFMGIGCHYVLGLDSVVLTIAHNRALFGHTSYHGVLVNDFPGQYVLFLREGLNEALLPTVLSHELIHLGQYGSGQLRLFGGDSAVYNGQLYVGVSHDDSPWEVEAYRCQDIMLSKVNRVWAAGGVSNQ